MKTYRALLAEIERLQRKAEVLRRAELKGVIKHIRELVAQHGLNSHDLGLAGAQAPRQFQDLLAAAPARARKAGEAAKPPASKGVARYRDPATGKTWTGRGKPPNWIAGAKDRKPFEIGAAGLEAAPSKAAAGQSAKVKRVAKPAAKAVRAPKGAKKPAAKKATARQAATQRAAPAKAVKGAKAVKAVKAAKLPKPPSARVAQVTQAARKKAKAPAAPAPTDGGNGAKPAPNAE